MIRVWLSVRILRMLFRRFRLSMGLFQYRLFHLWWFALQLGGFCRCTFFTLITLIIGSFVNCSVLSGWRYALVSAPLVWVSFSFSTLVSVHSFGCLSFLSGVAFLLLRFTMWVMKYLVSLGSCGCGGLFISRSWLWLSYFIQLLYLEHLQHCLGVTLTRLLRIYLSMCWSFRECLLLSLT